MSNFKYRLTFVKKDKMKFVGHLDLLKLFQRAIRRAKLPIHYSAGFNPHQETIFAMPLTLGMSTEYDIVDIRLTKEVDPEYIKNSINKELPKGFEIIDVRQLIDDEKNCAKELAVADYQIHTKADILNIARALQTIGTMEQWLIEKKSKKTVKEVDIKEDVLDMRLDEKGLFVRVATGSNKHLKPELLYQFICTTMGDAYNPVNIKITRLKMYKYNELENNELIEL